MLKEFVNKQRESVNEFFDHLDIPKTEELVNVLLDCKGIIFLTGVGKSGIIANKIAATMVSTGTRAIYLSPTDAVHGDMGMVTDQDVFILLSKSGESDELLSLLPAIRNKGSKMIALVCNPKSRLAMACHYFVNLPFNCELCPFDLAPTTSTTIQLLFGDLLAIELMHKKQFSKDEFVQNHPAGRIGKRLTMRVKDLMITGTSIPICSPQDKLVNVLVDLSNKKCGCVLIVDEHKKLQGIFTDGDLRRSLQTNGAAVLERPLSNLMTTTPKKIDQDMLAWEAMKYMEADQSRPIMVLPVIDKEQVVVGLVKMHDIVQSGL